jgi:hypothetical protein
MLTMNDPYLEIILNLKIISKLRAHDRLDTSQTVFRIHSSTYFIPLWVVRWWTRGSREHDIARLESLYKNAADNINDEDLEDSKRAQILTALEYSKEGLHNICTTYEADATIQARIEVIIDNAQHLIEQWRST